MVFGLGHRNCQQQEYQDWMGEGSEGAGRGKSQWETVKSSLNYCVSCFLICSFGVVHLPHMPGIILHSSELAPKITLGKHLQAGMFNAFVNMASHIMVTKAKNIQLKIHN